MSLKFRRRKMPCDICGLNYFEVKHTPEKKWLIGGDGLLYCPDCRIEIRRKHDVERGKSDTAFLEGTK